MKILIADKVSPKLIKSLEELGAEIESNPDLGPDDLPGAIGDAKVLIVRSTKVTKDTIDAASRLSLVVRAGAGVNTIDLEAASNRGTYVANTPGKNTDAVAELVIGLMIACDRGIANATEALRGGKWRKKFFGKASGLKTRTLGIIGTGAIGLATAKRAQALDMNILAWSRSLTPEKAEALGFEYAESPLEVASKADVVSVHVAAAAETKGMVNAELLGAMKDGAIFINASRGDVVDHDALLKAIDEKGLKVGLDVFANEPSGGEADFDQAELASKVTAATPHIGASTEQSEEAIAEETLRVVKEFLATGAPPNVVNLRAGKENTTTMVIRHFNRVGVLARVLDQLRDEGINVQEMQNAIFKTKEAACASLVLDKAPSADVVKKLSSDNDIIEVNV